jgi:hypothetical protein
VTSVYLLCHDINGSATRKEVLEVTQVATSAMYDDKNVLCRCLLVVDVVSCTVLRIGWITIESSFVAFFRVLLAQLVVSKIAFREGAVAMANEHLEVRKTKSIS